MPATTTRSHSRSTARPVVQQTAASTADVDCFAKTVLLRSECQVAPSSVAALKPEVFNESQLEHFYLQDCIGVGGMGAVYRAYDESLQREVAVKLITADSSIEQTGRVERLLAEARAQARVSHPGVVHIYYVSRNEDTPFLAMELVEGRTLAHELVAGPLTFDRVLEWADQMTAALACAARSGIVHGDLKPGNILINGADEHVKLSDFGLAADVYTEEKVVGISGTPDYLAPEVGNGSIRTIHSDMYSLGVMLFEMTYGRRPFQNENRNVAATLRTHREDEPDFPEASPEGVPAGWVAVLRKLLAKRPEDRFGNYDQLRTAIGAIRPSERSVAHDLHTELCWSSGLLVLAFLSVLTAQNAFAGSGHSSVLSLVTEHHPLMWGFLAGSLIPLIQSWFGFRCRT